MAVAGFKAAGRFAVDLVYPKRCAGCGRRGTWLCEACDAVLPRFVPPWCRRCGVPTAVAGCQCDTMPADLTAVRSLGPFDGWLRRAIVQFKYHGEWGRAEHFGPALATVVADLLPRDLLVPVPLHPTRMRQRGFNQSWLVAQHAAMLLDVAVDEVLVRQRRTEAQARLGARERIANVDGAFTGRPEVSLAGRTVVLIDDVITTGATLAACTRALRSLGASDVAVATLARELM